MPLSRAAKSLLDYKDVDPNRPDEDDRTPLGRAAVEGCVRVVTLLLGWKTSIPIALMRMLGHCLGVLLLGAI